MKNFKFVLLAIVAVLTISCSSSGSDGSDDGSTYIKFKVNGGSLISMIDSSTLTSMMASISATEDAGSDIRAIIFTIPVDATTGAHAITNASGSDLTAYSADYSLGDVYVNATSGTFTITSIGAEFMEGTFSFTGTDSGTGATFNITEGTFRVNKPTPAGKR